MASGALADGKFLVCRRQMKRLPIASVSLADTASNLRLAAQRQAPVREEREVLEGLGRENRF